MTATTTYYVWDKAQRLSTRFTPSTQAHYFTYNHRSMVTGLTHAATGADGPRYFVYNGTGERVVVTDNSVGRPAYWTFDGNRLLQDREQGSPALTTNYRHNDEGAQCPQWGYAPLLFGDASGFIRFLGFNSQGDLVNEASVPAADSFFDYVQTQIFGTGSPMLRYGPGAANDWLKLNTTTPFLATPGGALRLPGSDMSFGGVDAAGEGTTAGDPEAQLGRALFDYAVAQKRAQIAAGEEVDDATREFLDNYGPVDPASSIPCRTLALCGAGDPVTITIDPSNFPEYDESVTVSSDPFELARAAVAFAENIQNPAGLAFYLARDAKQRFESSALGRELSEGMYVPIHLAYRSDSPLGWTSARGPFIVLNVYSTARRLRHGSSAGLSPSPQEIGYASQDLMGTLVHEAFHVSDILNQRFPESAGDAWGRALLGYREHLSIAARFNKLAYAPREERDELVTQLGLDYQTCLDEEKVAKAEAHAYLLTAFDDVRRRWSLPETRGMYQRRFLR